MKINKEIRDKAMIYTSTIKEIKYLKLTLTLF